MYAPGALFALNVPPTITGSAFKPVGRCSTAYIHYQPHAASVESRFTTKLWDSPATIISKLLDPGLSRLTKPLKPHAASAPSLLQCQVVNIADCNPSSHAEPVGM